MKKEELDLIQNTIDYPFNNTDYLQQAFVRRSYSEENGGENNEVLEFIGDKALDIVVMKELMKRFGTTTNGDYHEFKAKYQEGKLTEIKKDLVQKKMLAKCIDSLGFNKYLIVGRGDAKMNVMEEDSVKEDLFEAIVGAVTIDSEWDLDAIEGVVKMMLDFDGYFKNKENEINYVGEVQNWSQKNNNKLPNYSFVETSYGYKCTVDCEGVDYTFSAEGKSKSGARFLAAKELYDYLDENDMLFSLEDEVGEADYDKSINQLQELYQKGYINEPIYSFRECKDRNGNSIWNCLCTIDDVDYESKNSSTSKKEAKKDCAFDMLCYIMYGDEDDYEEDLG